MSILFPKVPKPREWDYRPIYYDKEKEARKDKLARLHRGSFREAHEANTHKKSDQTSVHLNWCFGLLCWSCCSLPFITCYE
jgi:hypothetical protein